MNGGEEGGGEGGQNEIEMVLHTPRNSMVAHFLLLLGSFHIKDLFLAN